MTVLCSLLNLYVLKGQQLPKVLLIFTILILSTFATIGYSYHNPRFRFVAATAQAQTEEEEDGNGEVGQQDDGALPTVNDPNLKVEKVFEGLRFPTKMAFLGPNDILVLEKDNGTVQRIVNGKILPEPVLDVNVANKFERGLLGIAIAKHNDQQQQGNDADIGSSNSNNKNSGLIGVIGADGNHVGSDASTGPTYVFLYYTESEVEGSDVCYKELTTCDPAGEPLGNRLYRYELVDNKLVNPLLLLNLPSDHNQHNGGPVVIGPDQNVYVIIGDISHRTKTQNSQKARGSDGTSGILRVTQDGLLVDNPPLGDTMPLALYYAYGIRNSFGMDFDPVTGNLWATEAGLYYVDELNLVKPGFNSGWSKIDGMADRCNAAICGYLKNSPSVPSNAGSYKSPPLPSFSLRSTNPSSPSSYLDSLEDFGGRGKYSDPQFVWEYNPTPTAVKFLNSDKLGKQYENDLFVGDFNHGNLYDFKLNEDRTGLLLPSDGPLADKVANTPDETKSIIFGTGFGGITPLFIKKHKDIGGITDIEVGPDGYLYILTFRQTQGTIYRIVPR
ncbi:MAG TPA: PQQ-dependent sugar dehydrogenase [Nitrososphaeraceae archaeon]|nr:PQQ-dependent sugar dehydrogenase [Nitrososphaeraceae archaeon]